ncbi:MAG TPA: enoyl-CoA hydratase/isomerase family protein [Bradyrhizobium sp.]|jgi:enoyl-CoA hydratase/carnithine racemase|uniref:enoyl-CoA hydratase/isomerase family protein n=1 Tax=Bradyrhizobium sp. TaxID=376 RepID=UPI002B58FD6A|nr:enoyl-CoA hydratase/isomerase family protein [Bradyrhizobium sp.]HXB78066.1 enoyl-CoA hydratase/isomerase family protein [Bradyrhizobium sp.]
MSLEDHVIEVAHDGAVATVSMCFAPHNLMSKALMDGLIGALKRAEEDGARAIVLRSKLRNFCAGADLTLFENKGAALYNRQFEILPYLEAIEAINVPLIASVHGLAVGGGLELALACDIIIAADTARLGSVEVTLGVHPLMGGIQRVAARAGVARAKEMALLGRRYDAATLESWGIINTVVPEARLDEVTRTIAHELAHGPTKANSATKALITKFVNEGMAIADQAMFDLQRPIFESDDLAAGLKAFHEFNSPGHALFTGH